jgi:molybdate transport system substrate-binding protein
MRSKIAAVMLAGCLGAGLGAGAINPAQAADLVVSALGPTNFVMTALIPIFETATASRVAITYENGAAIVSKVKSGGGLDLVILPPQAIDDLVKEGKIAGGRTDLFVSGVGIAVKAGAPKPDISSADALKKTLLAAKSVAHSRAQSGIYFLSVLDRLGIADQMKGKLVAVESGPVGVAAAKGDAEIAIQQVTELMPVVGVDVVGPLPAELQTKILYSAGTPVGAKQPEAAQALIKFFASPVAAPVIKARGLAPAS